MVLTLDTAINKLPINYNPQSLQISDSDFFTVFTCTSLYYCNKLELLTLDTVH